MPSSRTATVVSGEASGSGPDCKAKKEFVQMAVEQRRSRMGMCGRETVPPGHQGR